MSDTVDEDSFSIIKGTKRLFIIKLEVLLTIIGEAVYDLLFSSLDD
jgi:hypothetical protein